MKKNVLLCFVEIVNFSGVHLALIKPCQYYNYCLLTFLGFCTLNINIIINNYNIGPDACLGEALPPPPLPPLRI